MINHFIGMGGGGSNILQTLNKEMPSGKFTMVSDPIREFLPDSIEFIHFVKPIVKPTMRIFQNDVEDSEMYRNLKLPSALLNRIDKDQHVILISSLGGYTGTILLDALISYCIKNGIRYSVFCGWPLKFEGPSRLNAAVKFRLKHLISNKVIHFKSIVDESFEHWDSNLGSFMSSLNNQISKVILERYSK